MRHRAIVAALALGAGVAPAAAQSSMWVRQLGTVGRDVVRGLAPDGTGGVFAGGETLGSLGGPYAGGAYVGDAWVARFDAGGQPAWIRQFGTSADEGARALAPDGTGGVYAAGDTAGSLAGPIMGFSDAWLARYDGSGNRLWLRQLGSATSDSAEGLASDGAGGAFVAGGAQGGLGGPNPGSNWDAWVARYDGAGSQVWVRQLGVSAGDGCQAAAPDGAGGVYVGGYTEGALGGPYAGGWYDAWVARYDAGGTRVWTRQLGTSGADGVFGLAPDGAGGAYVTGWTDGSLGGPHMGVWDIFLARYDGAGALLWVRQFGSSAYDEPGGLAGDGAGGVYVTGGTVGSIAPPAFGTDAWLTRYDAQGNRAWIRQFGSFYGDTGRALAPAGPGGVYVGGETDGGLGAPPMGGGDAWIARWRSCQPDCDGSGQLSVNDYICFQTAFALGQAYADCDGNGARDVNDYICFQTSFALACP